MKFTKKKWWIQSQQKIEQKKKIKILNDKNFNECDKQRLDINLDVIKAVHREINIGQRHWIEITDTASTEFKRRNSSVLAVNYYNISHLV